MKVVQDLQLYYERWDTLAQARFWQQIMRTPPERSLVNVASSRRVLDTISTERYADMSYRQKQVFKDSMLHAHGLPQQTALYVTSGKSDYYRHEATIPDIDKAVRIFMKNDVDPWYAQAILLIESPGKLRKSYVGAYGPFQLMRYVAVSNGLKVTREEDERADVEKAAQATARFIKRVCIPETRQMLDQQRIDYDEQSIWFRLLVLHVYHAGAGNVRGVLRVISPGEGGMSLIQTMWQTRYRGFGNSSQNYSQLALASLMSLDEIIQKSGEVACDPKDFPVELKPIPVPAPPVIERPVRMMPRQLRGNGDVGL